jgi:hypothetical protein
MSTTIDLTAADLRRLENRKNRRAARYSARLLKSAYRAGAPLDADDLAFEISERGWAA